MITSENYSAMVILFICIVGIIIALIELLP